MKKFFIILIPLILPFALIAQWQNNGKYLSVRSQSPFRQFSVSEDKSFIYTVSGFNRDSLLSKWDFETGKLIWERSFNSKPREIFWLQENGNRYVVVTDNSVSIHNVEDSKELIKAENVFVLSRLENIYNIIYDDNINNVLINYTNTYETYNSWYHVTDYVRNYDIINLSDSKVSSENDVFILSKDFNSAKLLKQKIIEKHVWQTDKYGNSSSQVDYRGFIYIQNSIDTFKINIPRDYTAQLKEDTLYYINRGGYYIFNTKKEKIAENPRVAGGAPFKSVVTKDGIFAVNAGDEIHLFYKASSFPYKSFNLSELDSNLKFFNVFKENVIGIAGKELLKVNIYEGELDANFSIDVNYVKENEDVHFTSLSYGNPDSFLWDFGDGETSIEENPTHKYKIGGRYTIKLTIKKGNLEDTEIKEKIVDIKGPLKADFDYELSSDTKPVYIKLINKTVGNYDSLLWQSSPLGLSTKEENPHILVKFPGKYIIQLTASSFPNNSIAVDTIEIPELKESPIEAKFALEKVVQSSNNTQAIMTYDLNDGFLSMIEHYEWGDYPIKLSKLDNDFKILQDSAISMESIIKTNSGEILGQIKDVNHIVSVQDDFNIKEYVKLGYNDYYNDRALYPFDMGLLDGKIYSLSLKKRLLNMYIIDSNKNVDSSNSFDIDFRTKDNIINKRRIYEEHNSFLKFENTLYYNAYLDISIYYMYNPNMYEWKRDTVKINNLPGNFEKIIGLFKLGDLMAGITSDGIIFNVKGGKLIRQKALNIKFTAAISNGTEIIAAGLIGDEIGIYTFTGNGDIIDSLIMPGRYGRINHISMTDDSYYVFSGYKQITNDNRSSYFIKIKIDNVKVKKQIIKDVLAYPNPSTGSAKISFYLKKDSNVKIKVYDLNGMLLQTLTDSYLEEKSHSFEVNLAPYSTNSLYYVIEAGDEVHPGNLIITR